MTTDLHTCSFDCLRPECIRAQQDELRSMLYSNSAEIRRYHKACEMALAAMGPVGPDLICNVSHHAKKDRHELSEPCPIQKRWLTAYQTLRAAIEASNTKPAK